MEDMMSADQIGQGDQDNVQISEVLYMTPEGVRIWCKRAGCCGGCGGGGGGAFGSPLRQKEFIQPLLALFPDPEIHPMVERYVVLGWMHEDVAVRMKSFGETQEAIDAEQAKIAAFLEIEAKQYVALGFQPINFGGYLDLVNPYDYEKLLLERIEVSIKERV